MDKSPKKKKVKSENESKKKKQVSKTGKNKKDPKKDNSKIDAAKKGELEKKKLEEIKDSFNNNNKVLPPENLNQSQKNFNVQDKPEK